MKPQRLKTTIAELQPWHVFYLSADSDDVYWVIGFFPPERPDRVKVHLQCSFSSLGDIEYLGEFDPTLPIYLHPAFIHPYKKEQP